MKKHISRKRFGQHFLINQNVLNDIITAINPQKEDLMIEIGPGLGAMTTLLLNLLIKLHAIEIDHYLIQLLQHKFDKDKLYLYEIDVLKFNFYSILSSNTKKTRIVGNLPYNISTTLLFYLMQVAPYVQDQHFMLQKQLAERIAAKPGNKKFGQLSVMLQWRYHIELLFPVEPNSFQPIPCVDSVFIRMTPYTKPLKCNKTLLKKTVSHAFSQRRKFICNSINNLFSLNDLKTVNINPQCRPESITIQQYVALANLLKNK